MLRVLAQLPDPFAQHILVHVQIPRRLGDRYAALPDQTDRLKFELAALIPSLHVNTPVP
jgi:hypothetical protein